VRAPLKLGPNELFVMGDNRNNSNDGRYWGPLPRDRVIGQAVLTFWPLSRIRWLR
jgi:signal peptidase I